MMEATKVALKVRSLINIKENKANKASKTKETKSIRVITRIELVDI